MTKIKINHWTLGVAALAAFAIFATVTRTFCGRWITGFTHETYPFHIPEMWISQWLDGLFHVKSEHQMDDLGEYTLQ